MGEVEEGQEEVRGRKGDREEGREGGRERGRKTQWVRWGVRLTTNRGVSRDSTIL